MKDETKELKTLKELADELGVSKQAVRKVLLQSFPKNLF